jgi:hypothetical protein
MPKKKVKKSKSTSDAWHETTIIPVLEITKTTSDTTSVSIKEIKF